jgi:hypothetical protein
VRVVVKRVNPVQIEVSGYLSLLADAEGFDQALLVLISSRRRKSGQPRDGILTRKDQMIFGLVKTDAENLTQARQSRAAELLRVEQAESSRVCPPGEETFKATSTRYLVHRNC